MLFRSRAFARFGAVALLASGAFAAAGAPAHAAGTETDLELTVVGTKLAAGSEGKIAWAKIANKGENTPSELAIAADLSGLDETKVIAVPITDSCEVSEPPAFIITCSVDESEIPGPGETLDLPVVVFKTAPGVGPYSGPVTFTISSPDDTTPDNNTRVAEVVLSEESGVDLGVEVPDVKERFDPASDEEPSPLYAGDTTVTLGFVYNWGDMIANGVKVTVRLPEKVTFAQTESDCEYSSDNRTAACTYKSIVLVPIDEEDSEDSAVAAFYWPITVDAGVEAPVTLPEGSWTVEALGQEPVDSPLARRAGANLPENVKMISAREAGVTEVDESDNVDGFAVVVSAEGGGTGGGGGLPVTGVQAGLLGAVGAAVIVAGAVMFLLARRRKVVLVTPGDEKPTA